MFSIELKQVRSFRVHKDAEPVLSWINDRGGHLALGGQLTAELYATKLKRLLVEWVRGGRATIFPKAAIQQKQTELVEANTCKSNDHHILALALVSKARRLYSRDAALQGDFCSPVILQKPRGKVYSSHDHLHLLKSAPSCASPSNT